MAERWRIGFKDGSGGEVTADDGAWIVSEDEAVVVVRGGRSFGAPFGVVGELPWSDGFTRELRAWCERELAARDEREAIAADVRERHRPAFNRMIWNVVMGTTTVPASDSEAIG